MNFLLLIQTHLNRLNGIISRSEFQQSIFNINRILYSRKAFGFFGVFIDLFVGILFCVPGCCIVKLRYANEMKKAIAMESMNYSSRSPTPCSWQLIGSRACTSSYTCGSFAPVYQLVIEIGNSVPSANKNALYHSNQIAPQQPSFFMQKSEIPSTRSTVAFCCQCGAPNHVVNHLIVRRKTLIEQMLR
jgi:hypothetical protein